MTRILADLPDDDIKWLDQLAAEQGKSRAAVLRAAVAAFRAEAPSSGNADWLEAGFGLWGKIRLHRRRHGLSKPPAGGMGA